jgi:hypothetical protein
MAAVPWGYRTTPVEDLGADIIIYDLTTLPQLIRGGVRKSQRFDH